MIATLYFILFMATSLDSVPQEAKSYSARKIKEKEFDINGKGDNAEWKNAASLTDFIYPWERETPPLTSFKALHSKDWLYLLYQVKDENVQVLVKTNQKLEVIYSDRVEIFLRKNKKMTPYYGLELDPNGRVYDYEATLHRQFNDRWTWPVGQLKVSASRTADGYIVEVAIGKESLKKLGLLRGNKLEAGLFRGECSEAAVGKESNIKWISWVQPDSPTPDFHIPSAFGLLVLED